MPFSEMAKLEWYVLKKRFLFENKINRTGNSFIIMASTGQHNATQKTKVLLNQLS